MSNYYGYIPGMGNVDFEVTTTNSSSSNSIVNLKVLPKVKKVEFFQNKITQVTWSDGTKTRVEAREGDKFSPEAGYAMCIAKKYSGTYEHFMWSLDKAVYYENGKKVKKSKKLPFE